MRIFNVEEFAVVACDVQYITPLLRTKSITLPEEEWLLQHALTTNPEK